MFSCHMPDIVNTDWSRGALALRVFLDTDYSILTKVVALCNTSTALWANGSDNGRLPVIKSLFLFMGSISHLFSLHY